MKKPFSPWIALFSLSTLYCANTVFSAVDPEKKSIQIASQLKSYSDQDWTAIAGTKTTEKYEIGLGDTLSDISERLFGEANVWPKIWEINNTGILNPHMIEPKMVLTFSSGSGFSLPSLALKSSGTSTVKNHYILSPDDRPGAVWDEATPMPSREWKNLPKQSWENLQINLPPNIDRDGFDSKNRIYLRKPATGLDLPYFVACAPVKPLGTIVGTRSITNFVDRGSEVTVRLEGTTPLVTQQRYTLLDPHPVEIKEMGRTALSYEVVGKITILGLQNGTYVGEIQNIKSPVARGAILVPEITRVSNLKPVAAATAVKGMLQADLRTGTTLTGQNKWVYIDRGTADGADRGMIFRIFQNQDPKTRERLTPGAVFVQGDVQIVQACERFSMGMFLWSRGEVPERYQGSLLSDVTDTKVRFYFNDSATDLSPPSDGQTLFSETPESTFGKSQNLAPRLDTETPKSQELTRPGTPSNISEGDDWLDKLDDGQGLKSEEENELQQLEKFQDNQAMQIAEPPSEAPLVPEYQSDEGGTEGTPL